MTFQCQSGPRHSDRVRVNTPSEAVVSQTRQSDGYVIFYHVRPVRTIVLFPSDLFGSRPVILRVWVPRKSVKNTNPERPPPSQNSETPPVSFDKKTEVRVFYKKRCQTMVSLTLYHTTQFPRNNYLSMDSGIPVSSHFLPTQELECRRELRHGVSPKDPLCPSLCFRLGYTSLPECRHNSGEPTSIPNLSQSLW